LTQPDEANSLQFYVKRNLGCRNVLAWILASGESTTLAKRMIANAWH